MRTMPSCDLLDIDACQILTVHETRRNELSVYCYIFKVIAINEPGIFHNVGRNCLEKYYLNQKLNVFEDIRFPFWGRYQYKSLIKGVVLIGALLGETFSSFIN